jgi:hypothetical protein
MKIIQELEEEFSSRRMAREPLGIRIRCGDTDYLLDEVELGPDLVLGRSGRTVYFFPLRSISEANGLEPRVSIAESLGGLLSQQKQPVKLRFEAGAELHSAWLLNVEGEWMRIASQQGVIWVPLVKLIFAQSELFSQGDSA